jgi:uncharacterized protein (DUF305 family)
MNITVILHPQHLPAWMVKSADAGKTEMDFVQGIVDSHGEVFANALIEAEKAKYDEIVTLAATLPEDKKQELVAFVRSLATPAPADANEL